MSARASWACRAHGRSLEPIVIPLPCSQYKSSASTLLEPLLTVMQSSPLMILAPLMCTPLVHMGSIPPVFGVRSGSLRPSRHAAVMLTFAMRSEELLTGTSVQNPALRSVTFSTRTWLEVSMPAPHGVSGLGAAGSPR